MIENYTFSKNPGDVVQANLVRQKSRMGTTGRFLEDKTEALSSAHFTVYPEALCVRPILSSYLPSRVVLDPFAGSRTTMKIALELERNGDQD